MISLLFPERNHLRMFRLVFTTNIDQSLLCHMQIRLAATHCGLRNINDLRIAGRCHAGTQWAMETQLARQRSIVVLKETK